MSAELNDRDWETFMGSALGLSISESGLLVDTDPQQDFTKWAWLEPSKPTQTTASDS